MRILKKVLIVIAILIALPFIIALFVKNDYHVEREVTVNRPKAEVFEYIKHLKNQNEYNVWIQADPNIKQEFRGTDGTVGFVTAWKGNDQVGEGEMEIAKITEGQQVDIALRFKKPFESNDTAYMSTEDATNGSTKVKWGMQGSNSYPKNIMNLFMGSMVGNSLQQGLDNLKTKLEK
jgi:capsular polysaccharide biosynthesis protein